MATAANIAIDTGAYGYEFTHWFKLNPTDLKDEIRSVYADVINNMQNKSLVIACSDGNAIWIGDVNNSIHLFSGPRNGTAWRNSILPESGVADLSLLSQSCRSALISIWQAA
jgi:hypothetical protein